MSVPFLFLPPSAAASEWLDEVNEWGSAELWIAAHDLEHGIWTMPEAEARRALRQSAPSYEHGASELLRPCAG